MCEVGSSSDQLSPGVAPKYLWLALVDAISAELDSATDFAEEVEPEVFTTRVISLPISVTKVTQLKVLVLILQGLQPSFLVVVGLTTQPE